MSNDLPLWLTEDRNTWTKITDLTALKSYYKPDPHPDWGDRKWVSYVIDINTTGLPWEKVSLLVAFLVAEAIPKYAGWPKKAPISSGHVPDSERGIVLHMYLPKQTLYEWVGRIERVIKDAREVAYERIH